MSIVGLEYKCFSKISRCSRFNLSCKLSVLGPGFDPPCGTLFLVVLNTQYGLQGLRIQWKLDSNLHLYLADFLLP